MISDVATVMNQTTIGDVIVAVMDAAMAAGHDEEIAAEIASRVIENILENSSPPNAKEFLLSLADHQLH